MWILEIRRQITSRILNPECILSKLVYWWSCRPKLGEPTAKPPFNVRIPNLTREQIDALCAKFKMRPGELVTLAVDRIFQQEQDKPGAPASPGIWVSDADGLNGFVLHPGPPGASIRAESD